MSSTKENNRCSVPLKRYVWPAICVVFTVLKLWLIRAQTLWPIAPSPHDDQHFLFQAEGLLRGEWLGVSNCFTLIKGAFYPFWLALNHVSGMPLLISQALLYVLACWAVVCAFAPVIPASWARSSLYLAALYNPASWDAAAATRLTRDSIYPSLTLLLFASAIGAVLRIRKGPKYSAFWALIAGMVGAFFVMTREEGIWVLPSMIVIVGWGVLNSRKAGFRNLVIPSACALLAYMLPISVVKYQNWKHYGVYETCETTADYFKSAYGALARVKPENWNQFVPVPKDVRRKIIVVSPSYRRIALSLESEAPGWIYHGCNALGICDDIAGGWFMWAFRDAVGSIGVYDKGMTEAKGWYLQMAQEIDHACSSGQLDCISPRSSLAPPWHNEYLPRMTESFWKAGQFLILFKDVSPLPQPSSINMPDHRRFEDMSNEHVPHYLYQIMGQVKPTPLASVRIQVLNFLTQAYSMLILPLTFSALFLLLLRIIRDLRLRKLHVKVIFTLSLLGAVLFRLLILSFIDASSFPAITTTYMAPAYVLYIISIVVVIIDSIEDFVATRKTRQCSAN